LAFDCRLEATRLSGKRKGRGNAKCGNRYLCRACEAANFAIRYNPTIAGWYH
jgi:transposase